MGVRQRGASIATVSKPPHPSRLSSTPSRLHPAQAAGALRRGLNAAGSSAVGIWSTRLAPPLTPLTASRAPSHATSTAS